MAHPHPSGPRKRDATATRDRLVRAALELFTTQGYHGTTTPAIAEKAGVAEGTIYRHFASKEQLLNEMYRAGVRLFSAAVRESPMGLTCRERLAQIARAWRDIAVRNPPAVRLVFVTELRGLLDPRSRDTLKELRQEIETVMASGKAAGEVRPGPVDVWADVWLELIRLVLRRVADKEWGPDQAASQLVIDSAWIAIANPQSEIRNPQSSIAAQPAPPSPSGVFPPDPALPA